VSRIGKMPINIPEGVRITINDQKVVVSGPRGELTLTIPKEVKLTVEPNRVICQAAKGYGNLWGLSRTLINNAVVGVTQEWTRTLELIGVGYRASVEAEDKSIVLIVGFSHPVKISAPPGIAFKVMENKIIISGCDKQRVGEMAAQLRRIRPPEPYKGKGIKYIEEKIKRKVGKVAKAIGVGGKA